MKKLLTLFCALLGFGAMASATTVDDDGYLDISTTSNHGLCTYEYIEGSKVATITINAPQWTETDEGNAEAYASLDATVDLTKEDLALAGLKKYESASYNAAEGDVFYYWDNGLWKCVGWWLGTFDASAYDKVVVTLSSTSQVNVCVQDDTYIGPSASSVGSEEDETVVVELGTLTNIDKVSQVYVQNTVANQVITVKSVQFVAEVEGEETSENVAYSFDDVEVWGEWQNSGSGYTLTAKDTEKGGLTFNPLNNSYTSKVSFQKNGASCMIGTEDGTDYPMVITPDYRVQLGGSGSLSCINVGVPVEGACYIYVVAASSGDQDGSRKLVASYKGSGDEEVKLNDGFVVPTATGKVDQGYGFQESTNCLISFSYTEEDAEANTDGYIYLYSASSGINIFYIYVSYDGEAPEFEDAVVVKPASEEIKGYLTVTVDETEVTTNEAVKITVTEGDDNEMTVAIDEFAISDAIKLSDVAVVFTPVDGEYTYGTVSGEVYISGYNIVSLSDVDAEGSYVVDEDTGDVKFTAEFSYSGLTIEVSFTTVEPVVSDGWKVIAEEFDATAVTADSNNTITISFSDLADAKYICIATTIDPDNNWGNYGALLTSTTTPNGGENMYDNKAEFEGVTNDVKNFANDDTETTVYAVIAVDDIVGACGDDATEFYLVFWSNALTVTVYASADYEGGTGTFYPATESGTEEGTPEAGWTLTEHTNVGYESITWEELEGYDAVKFVLYYDGAAHEGWGLGGIYAFADGSNAVYSWTGTADDPDTWIITVEDLIELVGGTEAGGFGYNTWSPVSRIEVYFGIGEFTTTAIANIKSDVEAVEVARYNLMGQKISGAEKGINIIVYSDGSAKKVLVK